MARRGSVQQKILLLLLGGLVLGFSRSPKGYFKALRTLSKEWKEIDRRALQLAIRELYKSNLVEQKVNRDGTVTFILTKEGKQIALRYDMERMVIKRHKWDEKWRIVMFDIPEKMKKIREIMRYHLKELGFTELQRSVFILPFECRNELEYIVEFYNIRKFVRYVEATSVDNELDLKQKFHLL